MNSSKNFLKKHNLTKDSLQMLIDNHTISQVSNLLKEPITRLSYIESCLGIKAHKHTVNNYSAAQRVIDDNLLDKEKLKYLYDNHSRSDLASILCTSESTLKQILTKFGIKKSHRTMKLSPQRKAFLKSIKDNGFSKDLIVDKYLKENLTRYDLSKYLGVSDSYTRGLLSYYHTKKPRRLSTANIYRNSSVRNAVFKKRYETMKKKHTLNSIRSNSEINFESMIKNKYPNIEILTNDRNLIHPYELDILFSKLKLAVEFNGVRYHDYNNYLIHKNDKHCSPNVCRERYKSLECKKLGYTLIHVWDNKVDSGFNEVCSYIDDYYRKMLTKD